jgi:hypothetical protein
VGGALGNDGGAVATIEVDAFDRAVVAAERTHVCPVDVTGFGIDRDTVRQAAFGGDDLLVRTVGTDGKDASPG